MKIQQTQGEAGVKKWPSVKLLSHSVGHNVVNVQMDQFGKKKRLIGGK